MGEAAQLADQLLNLLLVRVVSRVPIPQLLGDKFAHESKRVLLPLLDGIEPLEDHVLGFAHAEAPPLSEVALWPSGAEGGGGRWATHT
eukprot:2751455-Prymnesium_polylepis.2